MRHDTGTVWMTLMNGDDLIGYTAEASWEGDAVTVRRKSTQGADATETARDRVTEHALRSLIVPGVRPPHDFRLIVLADDCSGTWPGFLHLEVRRGEATIVAPGGGDTPANIPAWFLSALRDLVLVPREEEEDAA
jgi:hypothetical protein